MNDRLTPAQADTADFLAKLADYSYSRAESLNNLESETAIELGWTVFTPDTYNDRVTGLDFSIYRRLYDDGRWSLAVAFRGAQVTWRPELSDVRAGLLRGWPQWRDSRALLFAILVPEMKGAIASGGRVFLTGQSMGHMLVQFAAADLLPHVASDPELFARTGLSPRAVAERISIYGFGGCGVGDLLDQVPLPMGVNSSARLALIEQADIKHFHDSWDPARLLWFPFIGDGGSSWTAPKAGKPVWTAVRRSLILRVAGVPVPNLFAPVSFLWNLFYTAHSVTGYNSSLFARSRRRPR